LNVKLARDVGLSSLDAESCSTRSASFLFSGRTMFLR
jgi:hypothetical protein